MSKIKDLIHKLKASVYGTMGRIQFPENLTEPPKEDVAAPVPEETEEVLDCITIKKTAAKKTPAAKKPAAAKKTPAKTSDGTAAKKPGRPKKSPSTD